MRVSRNIGSASTQRRPSPGAARFLAACLLLIISTPRPSLASGLEPARLSESVEVPLIRSGRVVGKNRLRPGTPVVVLQRHGEDTLIFTRLGTLTVPNSRFRVTTEDFSITAPGLLEAATRASSEESEKAQSLQLVQSESPGAETSALRPTGLPNGSEDISSGNPSFEEEVFRLVNVERAKRKLAPLAWNENLARAARYHAADMARNGYFAHDSKARPEGSPGASLRTIGDAHQRIGAFDPSGSGENIAEGQRHPFDVMKCWMNSTGHRQNILNPAFRTIGIGFVRGYWVQDFGR